MKALADLIERLSLTRSDVHQATVLTTYLRATPDPERGLALGLLTGAEHARALRPAMLRTLLSERCDPVLLEKSLDYVGELAETAALIWPPANTNQAPPTLSEVLSTLSRTPKAEVPMQIASWLDACDPATRRVLIRLLSGGVKTGMSARAVKEAVADLSQGRVSGAEVEELWPALSPPFTDLLSWVEGRGPRPNTGTHPTFLRPLSADPFPAEDLPALAVEGWAIEYKSSGLRVQWVQSGERVCLFSAGGDDLSAAFPDLLTPLPHDATLDAVLSVDQRDETGTVRPGTAEDLNRRMRRKNVTKAVMDQRPACLLAFDLLRDRNGDLRALPLSQRRERLERLFDGAGGLAPGLRLSPLLPPEDLGKLHAGLAQVPGVEGLILKPWNSTYGGTPTPWRACLLAAHRFKGVLLYIQREPGGPNAAFSEFTLGALTPPEQDSDTPGLVPVAKVRPTLPDDAVATIQRFVRENTLERFGPVRSIRAALVVEVAFDRIEESARRKSGVTLRGIRTLELHADTPWEQADTLQSLLKLIA